MPKVLPEYLELRKQQIVDAAAACFAREGFHRTSMQDICAESDLSPGAVYRYFRSKEEIIQAMCLKGQEADAATIASVQELGNLQAILDELVRLYFTGVENRDVCIMTIELLAESRRDPVILDSLRRGAEAVRRPLAAIVRDAQARGELSSSIDADALSQVMLGLYQGLLWQTLVDPGLDPAPYATAVQALFAGVMTGTSREGERPLVLRH